MNSGNKILFFVLGLSLGVIAGGSTVFFYMNQQIMQNLHGNEEKNSLNLINRVLEFAEGRMKMKEEENQDSLSVANSSDSKQRNLNADSLKMDRQTSETNTAVSDKDKTTQVASIPIENVTEDNPYTIEKPAPPIEPEEQIKIKKDELLFVKSIEVLDADYAVGTNRDTVLTGIPVLKHTAGRMNVEFWKSPINYKGYKMGKNKLILFGIYDGDFVRIIKFNDNIYLKYNTANYKITATDNFMPLIKVMDEKLLLKLNQW